MESKNYQYRLDLKDQIIQAKEQNIWALQQHVEALKQQIKILQDKLIAANSEIISNLRKENELDKQDTPKENDVFHLIDKILIKKHL